MNIWKKQAQYHSIPKQKDRRKKVKLSKTGKNTKTENKKTENRKK